MYRHLLVPLDDSDLSIGVVSNAVGLARSVGARITFFHAATDAGHDDAYTGKAHELLVKAEAAARAFGVPCDSLLRPADPPATAIIEVARSSGCDLIFMASHGDSGRLGMALASQTLLVLMNAGLPVLVCATGNPEPLAHAIGILRDEHRSLAAVMHAWMQLLAAARRSGVGADARQMRGIVRYLQDFTTALHHPKEEQQLFRRLRERTDAFDAELDELQRQHQRDAQWVAELAAQVLALEHCADAAAATRALDDAVQSYACFLWEHLGREEGVILPAAQQHLQAADWVEIDHAFQTNRDLREHGDGNKAYRQLFSATINTV